MDKGVGIKQRSGAVFFDSAGIEIFVNLLYVFFTRFMALHKQDFGCFMALGFTRRQISFVLAKFTLGIAITGCLLVTGFGYLGSNVLMGMLESTYSFPYFEPGIHFGSVVNGILIPVGGTLLITICAVFSFMKQEIHDLLNISISAQPRPIKGGGAGRQPCSKSLPEKYRLSFRVALRK
ncbi:ABC transporter permease [Paenibacillus sp. FSL E2-8871]|uniref:ABC transporter permease n=1 Tax=Paenibacillus sp. FSL E2-8871 TaxID=2975326 RepID=UPI0030FB6473